MTMVNELPEPPLTDQAEIPKLGYEMVEDLRAGILNSENPSDQLEYLLADAYHHRASDIHLEPEEQGLWIRYRIDGLLRNVVSSDEGIDSHRLINALKAKAEMDVVDKRLPHDGRLRFTFFSTRKKLEVRVSTMPCVYGEKAVLHMVPDRTPFSDLDSLGFASESLDVYQSWLGRNQGVVIICGPTGSGKTNTLYASLLQQVGEATNVSTIEDPVEHILPKISQTQVNTAAGMSFSTGLRSLLRQDPDVIMVGEIRDVETAETAIHAGLTGHLVFTTLHTNDAPSVISRLMGMGLEPTQVCDALLGTVAQRLVRKVCPYCAQPYELTQEDLEYFNLDRQTLEDGHFMKGKGCDHCQQTGYLGREGVMEILEITPETRREIIKKKTLERQDIQEGMGYRSFQAAAIDKLKRGITTPEELRRVLPHTAFMPERTFLS